MGSLQRGMNFRLKGGTSIILMNVHKGAVYNDRIEENGNILIYEGHDIPYKQGGVNPKEIDQQIYTDTGKLWLHLPKVRQSIKPSNLQR